jgi:hypothetical protein
MADGSAGRVRTWNVWGDSAPNGEIDSTDWLHTLRTADADVPAVRKSGGRAENAGRRVRRPARVARRILGKRHATRV